MDENPGSQDDSEGISRAARSLGISSDVYAELKRVAHHNLRNYQRDFTLNCTALVHEAYLKLRSSESDSPSSKSHYLAVASLAMRQILVDYVRRKNAEKHGGNAMRVTLQESSAADETPSIDLLALDEALGKLAAIDPLLEKVVVLRFFGGLSNAETAEVLERSTRSVERDWARARMYLYQELQPDDNDA